MLAALASSALPVSAQAQTLALLEPDGELADAVRTALEPWGTEVRIVPAIEARGAARGAAAAETTGAVVVCWIEGAELWIYDARTGSAIARPVAPPPHDAQPQDLAPAHRDRSRSQSARGPRATRSAAGRSCCCVAGADARGGAPDRAPPVGHLA